MIYVDTSVVLAHLLVETPRPRPGFWRQSLVSSRLLEFEVWTRVHATGLASSHGARLASLLEHVQLLDMTRRVLVRALEPFPAPVRTLDALHLATIHRLRQDGVSARLATYDRRMRAAAQAVGVHLYPLDACRSDRCATIETCASRPTRSS